MDLLSGMLLLPLIWQTTTCFAVAYWHNNLPLYYKRIEIKIINISKKCYMYVL